MVGGLENGKSAVQLAQSREIGVLVSTKRVLPAEPQRKVGIIGELDGILLARSPKDSRCPAEAVCPLRALEALGKRENLDRSRVLALEVVSRPLDVIIAFGRLRHDATSTWNDGPSVVRKSR